MRISCNWRILRTRRPLRSLRSLQAPLPATASLRAARGRGALCVLCTLCKLPCQQRRACEPRGAGGLSASSAYSITFFFTPLLTTITPTIQNHNNKKLANSQTWPCAGGSFACASWIHLAGGGLAFQPPNS